MMVRLLLIALLVMTLRTAGNAADTMRMAVTTSFHNSGLSDVLLPEIEADLDLSVQLLVVGTGQALKLGRASDVDAILVHSRASEEAFVADGYAPHRTEIMYNDFVIIGPGDDPAGIASATTAAEALQAIEHTRSLFVSRGDDSGTHKKELSLWARAELDAETFESSWYRAVGAGMGAALNTASGTNAYVMSDRASWLKFGNKGDLALLFSGDPILFNQYAFLPISENRHAHVKSALSARLEAWLVSERGQALIADYRLNGEQLFTPNASPAPSTN